MKNFSKPSKIRSLAIASCIGAMIFSCQPEEEFRLDNSEALEFVKYQNGDLIPGQYIVVMKPTGLNSRKDLSYQGVQEAMRKSSTALLAKYRISEENLGPVYGSTVEGFAIKLTEEQALVLANDPSVDYIEQDRIVALAPPPGKGPGGGGGGGSTGQQTPWGITRVNGVSSYTGSGVAYIIDSGIDSSHPDLKVDASKGFNAFTSGKDSDLGADGNGHGTHVSGTVAAINNTIGVIGVAPGATVVPVKVLNSRGSGSYSGVIAGVDYVGANGKNGDVANMSLGGGFSQAVNDAVIAAASKGVKFALAAGNESTDASTKSPASANGPNIYTVSAMDKNDNWASFSNFGNPPVDYAAPGVGILSSVPGGGYESWAGTSMASPHVAGILLLGNIRSDGTVNNDPDGNPDSIAVH
ncbi:peptidase inhibitor I9 [Algoriphagus boseongensis]|uniref:Peptidase inhibitor I9 n=1 Tax=Algoriphagus boseongensis TaxID=1442587 RepID=A0A4R6T1R7_9BACT|nr:S8 family peptidase [Algoriphagus boseongensis]TDQ13570.1 peptidase inhibitor I9 [Algoriphagus boseongensis]